MIIKATQVFTPGAFPLITYVKRQGEELESHLRDGLDTPGQIVSIAGPSKSGKTVLVEKVVGRNELITIQGAGIRHPDDVWEKVLDWIGAPVEETRGQTSGRETQLEGSVKGSTSFLGLIKGETEGGGSVSFNREREQTRTLRRQGLKQVEREIGNSAHVVLIDDFHYMPRDVQVEVAKSLKEAVRLGIKICTASVIHRADEVVRANPELRGRVLSIDLNYWKPADLQQIALQGFSSLNADLSDRVMNRFVAESAGSPQLMQLICLQCCLSLGLREKSPVFRTLDPDYNQCHQIFERAAPVANFRSLVDVLDAGPKARGTQRTIFSFRDSTRGDVYRTVLKAIASDPPRLTFPYEEIIRRTNAICLGESPVGSSITGSCIQMSRLAMERFPEERVIDWDEQKQVLDIPNPYLLFYLRWSGKLTEEY